MRPGTGLHGIGQRIQIRIEPRTHVLNIKDQHVKGRQHLLGEVIVRTVSAVNGHARGRVDQRIVDLRARLRVAANAMLHRIQRRQVIPLMNQINRADKIMVDARGIGHQPHALSTKQGIDRFQPIRTAEHMLLPHKNKASLKRRFSAPPH